MNTIDHKTPENDSPQTEEASYGNPAGDFNPQVPSFEGPALNELFQNPEISLSQPMSESGAQGTQPSLGMLDQSASQPQIPDGGQQLYFIPETSSDAETGALGQDSYQNATDEARSFGVPRNDADLRQTAKQPESPSMTPFLAKGDESEEQNSGSPSFDMNSFDPENFNRMASQFSDRIMSAFSAFQTAQSPDGDKTAPQAAQAEQAQASPYIGQTGQAASPQFAQTGQAQPAPQTGQVGQFSPQGRENIADVGQSPAEPRTPQAGPQAGQVGQFSPQNKRPGVDVSQGPNQDASAATLPPPSQMSMLPGQGGDTAAPCALGNADQLSANLPAPGADPAQGARQASPRESLGPLSIESLEKIVAGFNDQLSQSLASGGSKTPADQGDGFNYSLFLREDELKKLGDSFSAPAPDIKEGPGTLEFYDSPLSLTQEKISKIAYQFISDIPPVFEQDESERPALPGEQSTPLFPLRESELKKLVEQITPPQTDGGQMENVSNFYFSPEPSPDDMPEDAKANVFDVQVIREDFPILHQKVHGHPLVWFDNAATTQKPQSVIDAIANFYARDNSNIHRGVHTLATRATDAYEDAREKVKKFLGAESASQIILPRGTTEAVNLVAQSYGKAFFHEGDEIIVTELEHHSNIIPWVMIAEARGAVVKVAPINDKGELILEDFGRLLSPKTRFVAATHVSNVLGTILPAKEIIEMAHYYGARVLLDGAQAVAHIPVDVQELDCDFYAFSGHKIFGPTGVGAVYGKKELLEHMPPWQGGGNMIDKVSFDEVTYNDPPAIFEAGTNNIAGAVGLGAALDYVSKIGIENIDKYERGLTLYAREALAKVPDIIHIGTAADKVGVLTFVHKEISPDEIGRYLDTKGIAVRSGHHCAQPALAHYGLKSAVRPSLALYNTREEVDSMVEALIDMKSNLN